MGLCPRYCRRMNQRLKNVVNSLSESPSIELTKELRRANRDIRREKQRARNIGLAEKMHKDRLLWEATAEQNGDISNEGFPATKLNVGCSGWFYWHWRDIFYPADSPTKNWFAHYAASFRTVELNAPFYGWPTKATVQSWIRQVNQSNFIYTVKVSELITHLKRFTGTKTLIRDFGHIADLLGPRMGCFLFQLPPSFQYSPARLKQIVTQLDPRRRNVVEFRHSSWWNEKVYDYFRDSGIIFCSCSGPRLPDELIKTADEVYIRFHGIKQWYRHDYSTAELQIWADRIAASGPKAVWAYFNNDRNGFAIQNARSLMERLKSFTAIQK